MGGIRVRLRVCVTGVCIVHELEDGPWEGVVDGLELNEPGEDSDGPGDKPVRGVMGEMVRSTGGVQGSCSSSDWVASSSSSSPDSSLETMYSDRVGEGLRRRSSHPAVTASPTHKT